MSEKQQAIQEAMENLGGSRNSDRIIHAFKISDGTIAFLKTLATE